MSEISFAKLEEIQQNEFIKAAIDRVGAGVVITDPEQEDNPMIYCNKGFQELTGYQPEEILGKNCRFLQGEETKPEKIKLIRQGLANREPVLVELRNYRKDGSLFWNELQIFPVYIEQMDQTYFVGVQKDVTKRREQEELIGHYLSELKRLSTPIVPIENNISVLPLIGTVDDERLQQMLETVSHHVKESKEDYLIMDMSAVYSYNEAIHMGIYQMNQLLDLMGTKLVITGIKPSFAIQSAPYADFSELSLQTYASVKQALQHLNVETK
ncbi:PAS domain-containing protein [Halobacillus sp. ACCC02827]|uniref:PAS domain-containing protein n=1 Tax=Bacillaceae TaxID=186817 RepID=UPI0002A4DC37|nr:MULTISPECIES: STAS domain-containing protein [Bacillaceae]ELK46278.1 blue-light photoreceptor [Halobacillus sp. BAB-2008]QHT45300.1 PAS domain-containing protein [Bacillus sp. SB49]WJE16083.1 PAS domain-containing protein [Halobacillus sp. ACCC02827]